MKVLGKFGISAAIGLLATLGVGLRAGAQFGVNQPTPIGIDPTWNPTGGNPQGLGLRIPPQGTWAEVINVTPKWIVVQNQLGQQFPIAPDHVKQFLVRWASSPALLTPGSMVEVTGVDAGSNTVIADHLDQFEADAQSLVTPTVQIPFGFDRPLSSLGINQTEPYGTVEWFNPAGYSTPAPLHVVGRAVGNDPVRVAGYGNAAYTIQPGLGGMSVSQVTLGTISFAKRGDLVYVVPEGLGPRSVEVSQLVLYKKIPLRQFQP